MSEDKTDVRKIVSFGSAEMLTSTYRKVKAEADKAGITGIMLNQKKMKIIHPLFLCGKQNKNVLIDSIPAGGISYNHIDTPQGYNKKGDKEYVRPYR